MAVRTPGPRQQGRPRWQERLRPLQSDHCLPNALIPKSVNCFSYDDASCLLEVRLYGPYYAHYEDELTYFDSKERENLSYGTLRKVIE
ncbi:hypothetical protein ZIOFF_023380 [Zingiber officinale]|uniref:Uncharacterized protein n=1 Tax=Zingiber officinale TaxID=94328 RepID=A0A8J5GWN7_ZINOF|nr:hypothetical protein ZIOFF_023380 [Zingiber officinale]